MPTDNPKTIEVVVKVTERCNINCSYCYVFNKGDESYKSHPVYIKEETIRSLAQFLKDGAIETKATKILIDFHGGEPLMMKKRRFHQMCQTLKDILSSVADIEFGLQTNAMLVDDEWIDIFNEFQISVGASLDGPKEINDEFRVDHKGRGTYERTIKGLRKLVESWDEGLIPAVGLLNVINPSSDATKVFNHFVNDLGIYVMDYLLPIESHDEFDRSVNGNLAKFLCVAFDKWVARDDQSVYVRLFADTLARFSHGKESASNGKEARERNHIILTVASNGDIGPDDSLRTLNLGLFDTYNVCSNSYIEWLNSEEQRQLVAAENTIPDDCQDCAWVNVCRGGAANGRLINRYSRNNGFNNVSIVCEALREFYSHVAAFTLQNGLSYERLKESLIHQDIEWGKYQENCEFSVTGGLFPVYTQPVAIFDTRSKPQGKSPPPAT